MRRPLVLVLIAGRSLASTPVLPAGACTYLTGAPTGAALATSDEPSEGSRFDAGCTSSLTLGTRAFGDDSAQLNMGAGGVPIDGCDASSFVGHAFFAGTTSPSRARIDMAASLDGNLGTTTGTDGRFSFDVSTTVQAWDPALADWEDIARTPMFSRNTTSGHVSFAESLHYMTELTVEPGVRYRVLLVLAAHGEHAGYYIDFGPGIAGVGGFPGTGRGARIDSIEVCIDAPPDDSALRARLDALELADLEAKLYRKECMPGVWMPLAQGGKLETARQLVADRLAQATATADPNVNARVATMRLQSADEDITAGQYQRACRDLADGLHALTTP